MSGTYLGSGPSTTVMIQIVETCDGNFTGRYEQVGFYIGHFLTDCRFGRSRPSPRISKIGAAMKIDELAPTMMPNTIAIPKLSTALPPANAIGSIERKAVAR